MSPKRPRKRATVCGVSEISGTSTMAVRPWASTPSMACRYTSVLPDPVTPSTTTTLPLRASHARRIPSSACDCPFVSWGLALGTKPSPAPPPAGTPRMRRRCSTTTTPRVSSALSDEETFPYSATSSLTRKAPICRAARMDSCLTAPLRGLKSCALGPSLTQRSSTWPVAGSHTTHCPFCLRTVGVPPGGVNRRTQLESGAM